MIPATSQDFAENNSNPVARPTRSGFEVNTDNIIDEPEYKNGKQTEFNVPERATTSERPCGRYRLT